MLRTIWLTLRWLLRYSVVLAAFGLTCWYVLKHHFPTPVWMQEESEWMDFPPCEDGRYRLLDLDTKAAVHTVESWNPEGTKHGTLTLPKAGCYAVGQANNTLACLQDDALTVWDLRENRSLYRLLLRDNSSLLDLLSQGLRGHSANTWRPPGYRPLVSSANGEWIVVQEYGEVILIDHRQQRIARRFPQPTGYVAAINNDGTRLFCCLSMVNRPWIIDTNTGIRVAELSIQPYPFGICASWDGSEVFVVGMFSRDQHYQMKRFRFETGELVKELNVPITDGMHAVGLSINCLRDGGVAIFTTYHATSYPLLEDGLGWLEKQLGIRFKFDWRGEQPFGHLCVVDPNGRYKKVFSAKHIEHACMSHDGERIFARHSLMQDNLRASYRYTVYHYPFYSAWLVALLYGLLAALPLLLMQLMWQLWRRSRRITTLEP